MTKIVTYADGNYIQHAVVMVRSLLHVRSDNEQYQVYLFCSDCSDEQIEKARLSVCGIAPEVEVEIVHRSFDLPPQLKPKRANVNASIFNKLLIYDFLPNDWKKVIFIDADVVLKSDPADLYRANIGDYLAGAVREKVYLMEPKDETRMAVLGLKDARDYFNSGVMVVDLEKWREENVTARALGFAIDSWDKTPYHDQDALNAIIAGRWKALSVLWNPRGLNELEDSQGNKEILTSTQIYERGLEYLVHYSGPHKPWLYLARHPKKSIYLSILAETEFREYKFPDLTLRNRVRKLIRWSKQLLRQSAPLNG